VSDYTVVGLINPATDVLEIAGMIPGHITTCDRQDNVGTTRWTCHIMAGDASEAETFAHNLHELGGIPAEHRPTELTLGSVVVDDHDHGRHVRRLSLDGDTVRVWFTDDDHDTPATFSTDATVRAVITPLS